jgi:hypothetical protein
VKINATPDQIVDWASALGAADSLLRDLAQRPDTNGIMGAMARSWARSLREIQAELTRAHNEESGS